MSDQDSRLVVERMRSVTRVDFLDPDILDEPLIQRIGDRIGKLVEEDSNPRLILNFQEVEHLSSAALGALISINNKVREKGGQLRLACINPRIYEVFAITKLNKLFQIHDTVQEAVDSLG